MALNGKRDHFTRADLKAVVREMNSRRADELLDEVLTQVARWPEFAAAAGMSEERAPAVEVIMSLVPNCMIWSRRDGQQQGVLFCCCGSKIQ
jgi:hypothetical protein